MLKRIKANWKRTISSLLAIVMTIGILPSAVFATEETNPYAPTGDFELHIAGTTAWNGSDQPLTVYKAEGGSTKVTTVPTSTAFALLEDNGGDRIKIGYVEDDGWTGSTLDGIGWVDKDSVLVNLPGILPSIAYDRDTSKQFSSRLTRFEYVIPATYAMAEQLALLQREAMAGGDTLVVRQTKQAVSVSRAKGDPAQLHSYSLDGAVYQKYDAWTEYNTSDADFAALGYELPIPSTGLTAPTPVLH